MACPRRLATDKLPMETATNTIRHLYGILVVEYIVLPPDFNCGAPAKQYRRSKSRTAAFTFDQKTFTYEKEPHHLPKQQNPRSGSQERAIVHLCHSHCLHMSV